MGKIIAKPEEGLRVVAIAQGVEHPFYTDVSKEYGGLGAYPSPTDLLCASVGNCMVSMMALYAKKVGIDITGLSVSVDRELDPQHHLKLIRIVISCSTPLEQSQA